MHLITGMLLAALAGKRSGTKSSFLPRHTGPVRLQHELPGRIRFRVPSLRGNLAAVQLVREKLPTLDGVESVQANAVTGSVLIAYQEDQVNPGLLFTALVRLLGLDAEYQRPPSSVIHRELGAMGSSLNRAVHERTAGILDLRTAMLIGLAAFGIKELVSKGSGALPAGFTLLWWAMNGFSNKDQD